MISGDARIARYAAYSSAATNIAVGAGGGQRNIFLVKRGGSAGRLGTPWKFGSTKLASRGRGGPANGDSYSPALGGWTRGDTAKKPRCLGFVSQASNLVAGDSNNRADGFTRRLPSGKTKRVKSPAAASEIAVSGDCRTIALVAGGSLYVKRGGASLRVAYPLRTPYREEWGASAANVPGPSCHPVLGAMRGRSSGSRPTRGAKWIPHRCESSSAAV